MSQTASVFLVVVARCLATEFDWNPGLVLELELVNARESAGDEERSALALVGAGVNRAVGLVRC